MKRALNLKNDSIWDQCSKAEAKIAFETIQLNPNFNLQSKFEKACNPFIAKV